jgi:ABC-type cobalamin/Fe3+-siderophores transport system ATPase subunit
MTAILGPNGVGKSTILHLLACVNNPVIKLIQTVNHRLSEFFTPTTHSIYKINGINFYTLKVEYIRKYLTQNFSA